MTHHNKKTINSTGRVILWVILDDSRMSHWVGQVVYKPSCNVHSLPTCPLDFHRPPSVNSVPLSPLHKGTIVSAPSPLLFRALRVTCLRVVLGILNDVH